MDLEKVFFNPGDLVILKQDIPNKPVMYVVEKVTTSYKKDGITNTIFKGIRCRWFDTTQNLQEAVFSTKDLCIYE